MPALHRIRTRALEIPLENASGLLDSIRLTFVMGCPRSGTTFLLRCLDALPRTRGTAGTLIPDRVCHLIGSGTVPPAAEDDLLFSFRAVLWKWFVDSMLSRRGHLRRVAQAPGSVRATAGMLLGRSELPLEDFGLVYKEPFLTMAAASLARHFPNARFVHLIRDGRDCADSLQRSYGAALSDEVLDARSRRWREVGSEIGVGRAHGEWIVPWWVSDQDAPMFLAGSRYERYLWLWRECVTRGREAAGVAGGRYLEVRYEDLCAAPRETGSKLATFLGVAESRRFRKVLGEARTASIGGAPGEGVRAETMWEPVKTLLHELGYAGT